MRLPFPGRSLISSDSVLRKAAPNSHNVDTFNALVDSRMGYDLLWSRALRCSCRANDTTENPDPAHSLCGGTGWRYVHPHPELWPRDCNADGSVAWDGGEPIRGLLTGQTSGLDPEQGGTRTPGDAELSVRPEVHLGFRDRLIQTAARMPYDQVLKRLSGHVAGSTVPTGYGIDKLRFPIAEVLAVHTASARFRLRTDFQVSDSGTLVWLPHRGPADGEYYSIRYLHHPRWIVVDLPRSVIGYRATAKSQGTVADKYVELPQKAKVKLEFLLFDPVYT